MAKKSAKARMAYARSFRKNSPKRKHAVSRASFGKPPRRKKLHYKRRVAKNRYEYVQNPRRRYKRNAFPMAGLLANRRRHKRNPSIMGFQLPPIKVVAYATAGFMGVPLIESYVNKYLPASITSSPWGRYAVKIGITVGLTYAAKRFLGPEPAKVIGVGGGTYVLVSAINEFLVPKVTGTASYGRSTSLGAYSNSRQLGMSPTRQQLGAGGAQSRSGGASSVTASRFNRFAAK